MSPRLQKPACPLTIAVLAILLPVSAAGDAAAAGVVVDYAPIGKPFSILRYGAAAPIPAAIGVAVRAGDRIELPANGSVVLLLADDRTYPMSGPGVFTVPEARAPGAVRRLLQAFAGVLADAELARGADAVTRGGGCERGEVPAPITVPILRTGARVEAGVRDLPLAWAGGCPPFRLSVHRGESEVGSRTGLSSQGRLDALPLTPGAYVVEIAGANGSVGRFALEAVEKRPTFPDDLSVIDGRLGVIARALWLADVDGGAWRLDSFELLRPLVRGQDRLAGSIGDALLFTGPERLAPR
jgi:hypothetical protein